MNAVAVFIIIFLAGFVVFNASKPYLANHKLTEYRRVSMEDCFQFYSHCRQPERETGLLYYATTSSDGEHICYRREDYSH